MLEEILDKKNNIWNFYNKNLDFNKFIKQKQEQNCQSSKWMYAIRLPGFDYHSELKDENIGFETRPMFYPMSKHLHLNKYSKFDEKNANLLSKECFMIPSHPNLTENDLEFIVNVLNKL
jgi:dTDP-4-amino-4,6-dideoxygalactose transaminase